MRKPLAIAWKDVRAVYRNPAALAMMLLAPVALAALLGFAFGGSSGFTLSRIDVVVADLDTGTASAGSQSAVPVGRIISDALGSTQLSGLFKVSWVPTAQAARRAVDDNEADVAVIVPAGASNALTGLADRRVTIELYENPTDQVSPAVVAGVVEQLVGSLNGGRAAAATAVRLATSRGVVDAAALQRSAASAAATFGKAAQGAGLAPLVEREPLARAGDQKAAPGVAGQVLAGMMIFFMMFGALNVARGILEEDEEGTLRRLFTTPTPLREILGGKFLSIFLTVLVQIALLLAAGRLIFGTRWGGPAQVVLLTVDGAAVGAGLAVLLISLARTSRQAGSVSSGVVLVLALLGGNFVGSVSDTGVFSVIQRLTPNGWLLRAWITTLNGGSLSDIVLALLLVAAFALVTFSLGLLRFRHRYA